MAILPLAHQLEELPSVQPHRSRNVRRGDGVLARGQSGSQLTPPPGVHMGGVGAVHRRQAPDARFAKIAPAPPGRCGESIMLATGSATITCFSQSARDREYSLGIWTALCSVPARATHGGIGSYERDGPVSVLLELTAGLEYLSSASVGRYRGDGSISASIVVPGRSSPVRLRFQQPLQAREDSPGALGAILTTPVVLQDVKLLDDPQRDDQPHRWRPVTEVQSTSRGGRNSSRTFVSRTVDPLTLPRRGRSAVGDRLARPRASRSAGRSLLGPAQRADAAPLELADPPVATRLEGIEHIEVQRDSMKLGLNAVKPANVRLRERQRSGSDPGPDWNTGDDVPASVDRLVEHLNGVSRIGFRPEP